MTEAPKRTDFNPEEIPGTPEYAFREGHRLGGYFIWKNEKGGIPQDKAGQDADYFESINREEKQKGMLKLERTEIVNSPDMSSEAQMERYNAGTWRGKGTQEQYDKIYNQTEDAKTDSPRVEKKCSREPKELVIIIKREAVKEKVQDPGVNSPEKPKAEIKKAKTDYNNIHVETYPMKSYMEYIADKLPRSAGKSEDKKEDKPETKEDQILKMGQEINVLKEALQKALQELARLQQDANPGKQEPAPVPAKESDKPENKPKSKTDEELAREHDEHIKRALEIEEYFKKRSQKENPEGKKPGAERPEGKKTEPENQEKTLQELIDEKLKEQEEKLNKSFQEKINAALEEQQITFDKKLKDETEKAKKAGIEDGKKLGKDELWKEATRRRGLFGNIKNFFKRHSKTETDEQKADKLRADMLRVGVLAGVPFATIMWGALNHLGIMAPWATWLWGDRSIRAFKQFTPIIPK